MPSHAACCVKPTPPTPSTLPASSTSGFTLEITTSATRVDFSSTTPPKTFWPWNMIDMNSSTPTMMPASSPPVPEPDRPRSVRRSDLRRNVVVAMSFTTSARTPSAWSRAIITSWRTIVRSLSMSLIVDAFRPA